MLRYEMSCSTNLVLEFADDVRLGRAVVEEDGQLLQSSSVVGHVLWARSHVPADLPEDDVAPRQREWTHQRTAGVEHLHQDAVAAVVQRRVLPRSGLAQPATAGRRDRDTDETGVNE